ncbi:uncharacterized protein LOC123291503 [Chrysoperla carnea]|uniref:uncharacterized protein LOC123291503 n=1 Tax=Chrysoperla carnea TaxID=189513 RepID=UPI001D06193E|nr:uncharacterized protein LOC123291503 [Chrysoperla carnea]
MASSRKRTLNVIQVSDDSDTSSVDYIESEFSKTKRNRQTRSKRYSETSISSSRSNNCLNKNAQMARENRIRKKMYVENLENDIQRFKKENEIMQTKLENKDSIINELKLEVKYLKSILSNSKEIGLLLNNITRSSGLPVTTSLKARENLLDTIWNESDSTMFQTESNSIYCNDLFPETLTSFDSVFDLSLEEPQTEILSPTLSDHRYSSDTQVSEDDVGVCLHVSGKRVALEFCSKCNSNAQDAWKREKKDLLNATMNSSLKAL